jgi:hypothetical protein
MKKLSDSFTANQTPKKLLIESLNNYKKTLGEGFFLIRGLLLLFFIDACLTDDEPL